METYSPYIVIEDTPLTLHLKEPQWRVNAMFFVFRILPLFFVAVIIGLIITAKDIPLPSLILTAVAIALPVIFLFTRAILVEVEITAIAVRIKTNNIFAARQKIIAVADVDKIICRRKRGKYKGFIYSLVTKPDGKRYRFLRFGRFFMDKTKMDLVIDRIQKITKVQIENI